jgi:glycine cleavage system H protein
MNVPEDCRYTKDHEWVKAQGDQYLVGITEFAQSELGELVFVEVPAPGKKFTQGAKLCVVESTKAASDVYAPVAGTVAEGNAALTDQPDLVNKEPYGKGWLVKLKEVDKAELDKLMTPAQYRSHLGVK